MAIRRTQAPRVAFERGFSLRWAISRRPVGRTPALTFRVTWERKGAVFVLGSWLRRIPLMPSSLQYPLERQRDVQRRWGRLLQLTLEMSPPRNRNDHDDLDEDEDRDED
jgi:hypothetical protein